MGNKGMVLVLVLVVVAVLSLAGFTFAELMLAERRAAQLSTNQSQARASVDSGVEMVRLFLTQTKDAQTQAGGWYDNSQLFRGRLVIEDAQANRRARFTIVSPQVDSSGMPSGIRFGLEDESARLNLNTLVAAGQSSGSSPRERLMALPGMTEEIADAIIDWIDPDDTPSEFGAEVDYYSSLSPPYAPANGPLKSIEELLLVRGVTPGLLFGYDMNRNWLVDSAEAGASLGDVDNSDGSMNCGWAAYLTLWSMERNVRTDGTAKVNLNQSDMQKLYDDVVAATGSTAYACFIVAYRQNGPYSGANPSNAVLTGADQLDLTKAGGTNLTTILDLIGKKVQITFKGAQAASIIDSPFLIDSYQYLDNLVDTCTADSRQIIPGRVNINQAPKAVLMAIPGMTSTIADQIVSMRVPDPAKEQTGHSHETWLLAEGIVTLDVMKTLLPYVTGGGSVYRAQVIGYCDGGGAAVRAEAILDATESPPKLIFWRDLSHLGRGYTLDTLGTGSANVP